MIQLLFVVAQLFQQRVVTGRSRAVSSNRTIAAPPIRHFFQCGTVSTRLDSPLARIALSFPRLERRQSDGTELGKARRP